MMFDDPNDPDNYDEDEYECPACAGSGKANVNDDGEVQDDNLDELDCGYCDGTGTNQN